EHTNTPMSGTIKTVMQVVVWFACLISVAFSSQLLGQVDVTPLGPFGGDVRSLVVHPQEPDVFFLGTSDGQIYVSKDSGENWGKLIPGINRRHLVVDNLAFDPSDPRTLYAATWELNSDKGWLWRSRDSGQSWEEVPLGRFRSAIRAIAIAPSDSQTIALGISEGVIVSRDGGQSWDRITRGYRSLYNAESLAFDPTDAETLYVGTWRLGWKTTNLGKKWNAIHEGMIFDSDMFSVLVNPEDPQILYASACTGIYRSGNGGLKWTKLKKGLPTEARRTRTLHLDPSDPDTVYAGTTLGLFGSHDGGISWQKLTSDVVVNSVAVHPGNNQIILVGTDDAGIMKSSDGGSTFQSANRGFIHRQVAALASDPTREGTYYANISSDGQYGGFFYSLDHGLNWSAANEGLEDTESTIDHILASRASREVFLATPKGVFAGIPSQPPWHKIEATAELKVHDMVFANTNESSLFLATSQGVYDLNLTTNQAIHLVIPDNPGEIHAIFYDHSTDQLLAGTDNGIFRSSDRGETWHNKSGGLPGSPVNVIGKSGTRLFSGTRNGLFASDNSGQQWSRSQGIHPIDIVDIQTNPRAENQIFAADLVMGQLFFTTDGGDRWEIVRLGTHNSRVAALSFSPSGRLLAGTNSDGVYEIAPLTESSAKGR
ncbi:MAG: hypothetical protein V3R94_01965, partial [Acidobacteriota bacterium]